MRENANGPVTEIALALRFEARYTEAESKTSIPSEAFMCRSRLVAAVGALAATLVVAGTAVGGVRTYVALAGRDDAIPKLGMPGIALHVEASSANDAALVTAEVARELAQQAHTRRLAADEVGDYELEVTVETPRIDGSAATVPFEVVLKTGGGERLWRVEGRSDVDGEPLNASVFADIGRNVVSALIHDGWVQPRYDPDNPPPPPPNVRRRDDH